jgi:hypothetical protein
MSALKNRNLPVRLNRPIVALSIGTALWGIPGSNMHLADFPKTRLDQDLKKREGA